MSQIVSLNELPPLKDPVVTMGSFDGLHRGHQKILAQVRQSAIQLGGHSVLISFEPHPRKVLFPDRPLSLLTPPRQKKYLLQKLGIDYIVIAPFTEAFSCCSAHAYIDEFLVPNFHPRLIIIGYDHRFGHDRTGDIHLLRRLSTDYGYEVREISAELIHEAAISSTQIRRAIGAGELESASEMLDRPYSVWGRVVRGAQKGRTLGYPTANLALDDPQQLLPPVGVYAGQVRLLDGDSWFPAMINLGYRPSFYEQGALILEAHLLDFSGSIYDLEVELSFLSRIRDEKKFSGIEALKAQLKEDEKRIRARLSQLGAA